MALIKFTQANLDDMISAINGRIKSSEKGAANGVATLDASSLIPVAQLPAAAKGVAEYANFAAFPATGDTGRIYVDTATGVAYRWDSGTTAYVKLAASVDSTLLGANNGIATLDGAGKVPSSQLPSYVDDVIEAADVASLPATGETGKIYVTIDTGFCYRWSGAIYVQIASGGAAAEALKLTNARTISVSGDATGSNTFDGSANMDIALTLKNSGVTAGTYQEVTVDAKGIVSAATAYTAADLTLLVI